MTQSVADLRKVLNRHPEDPATMLAMASALMNETQYGAAYHLLRRCLAISKDLNVLIHYGKTLMLLGASAGDEEWLYRAERVFMDAVHRYPESPEAVAALGICALQLGRHEEAERLLRIAISHKPEDAGANQALAVSLFYREQWGEGFDYFDKAFHPQMRFIPDKPEAPYWDGTKGKKLMVFGEQGIGDEISFGSMIPDAAAENEITFLCTPRLAGLMQRSLPNVDVIGLRPTQPGPVIWGFHRIAEPTVDAKCLLATLGRFYRRASSDFPRKGYLVADPVKRAYYRAEFDKLPGRKIGIAWTGGLAPSFWHRRGLDEESLKSLLDIEDASFISLQYHGTPPAGMYHYPMATGMHVEYDETAALVSELDHVITVTTSIAHLCGALGKPAHVLVNKIPRWFYGLSGSDHLWYESLILHRQTNAGWPIDAVKEALKC